MRSYGPSLEERREELQGYASRLRKGTVNSKLRDEYWDESDEEIEARHEYNRNLADRIEKKMQDDPNYDGYGEIGYTVVKNGKSKAPITPAPYINISNPNHDRRSPDSHIVNISRPDSKRLNPPKQRLLGLTTKSNWRNRRDRKYEKYQREDVSRDEQYSATKTGIETLANALSYASPTGAAVSNGWAGDDDGYYLDFYFTDSHGFDGQRLADATGLPVRIMDDLSVRIYYEQKE